MMRKDERGFTLIELLIVMAVSSMLLAGLVTAMFQVFDVTRNTTATISAFETIKTAAYWITQDVKRANTTTLVDGGAAANSLTLNWTIWYDSNGNLIQNGQPHSVAFTLSGTSLRRNLDGNITTIGNNVSSLQFSRQGNMIAVSITATPDSRADSVEKSTYYVYLQSKASPIH